MAEASGGKFPIDFNNYIGGEEALANAQRKVRELGKSVTAISKTITEDGGRITSALASVNAGIAEVFARQGKLNLFSAEDKATLLVLAQQLGGLKKQQAEYKEAQTAQAVVQKGLTESVKAFNSELAKNKQALREAAAAGDIEGQKKAAAAIRQTTLETKDLNAALRGANSTLTAAAGSYDALVANNAKLTATLRGLEGGLSSTSKEAENLRGQIAANNETLLQADKITGLNYRNVGNYAQSFSGLIAELAKARAAQSGLTEGSAAYNRNLMEVRGFQTAAQKSAAQMGLSFEQAEAKIEGISAAIQPLTTSLVRLEKEQREVAKTAGEESKEFQVLGFQIQKTKKDIDDVAAAQSKAADSTGGLTEQLGFSKQGLEQFALGLASGAIGLQALLSGVQSVFQANVEYSRNLAEVRKTTGLTADEAERLAQSLKALDTPTSLAGLLKIAAVGGQLGIAKGDLLEFTKAIDTAVQALGNDFAGGAEEIATTLGKISSVFGKELGNDPAKNILAIGSAVNQLGAEGAATAPFLTDVALRVGALASSTGVGLKNVLAYAAVLQETGSTSEVAGTALNRFFGTLTTKTKEAFEIAKLANPALTLKEFTRLVNTDFNQAIQVFLRGLKEGGKSTTDQARLLATLKLQSGEAKNAIITLSQNTELFAERQKSANDQLRDATSLADEAKVNVETLAGSVDAFGNDLKNFVTTGGGSSFLKFLVDFERDAYKLTLLPFKLIGDGIGYIKDKISGAKKPQEDYTVAVVANTRELLSQADAQQKLLDSYTKLAGQATRTGAEELELQQLRGKLGTADVAAVQASIDKRKEQAETNIGQLRDQLAQQLRIIEQYSQQAAVLQARVNEAPMRDGRPTSFAGQQAADELLKTQTALNEADQVRKNVLAALAKLEGQRTQAVKDGTEATTEAEKAELQLDRTAQERAKNRASQLRDELADNQTRITELRKYQAEQGKLFADKQITPELFAERVAGSEDLAIQLERNGTAIRIKIARAEADEKLEIAENDRIRQSKKKEITQKELNDIQGQYAERSVEIERQKVRKIEEINREAAERQGAVEQLEFKVPEIDYDAILRNRNKVRLRSYETEIQDVKRLQAESEAVFTQAYADGKISREKYDREMLLIRQRANQAELKLDKQFGKDLTAQQREQAEIQLALRRQKEQERLEFAQFVEQQISNIGGYYFQAKQQRLTQEANDAAAAKEQELTAAGENEELKSQINEKYRKIELEQKKKQAEADRQAALFQIAINTAMAVTSVLSTGGGTRYADFGISAATLSAIVIANGLIQAGLVLSQPLPAYFKGRKGGKREFAEVAERGPELIERVGQPAGKRYEYVAQRSVALLNAGDSVHTAATTSQMLAEAGLKHSEAAQPMRVAQAFSGAAEKAREGREAASVSASESKIIALLEANTAALKKFKPTTVNVHRGSDADVEISNQLTKYRAQRLGGGKTF